MGANLDIFFEEEHLVAGLNHEHGARMLSLQISYLQRSTYASPANAVIEPTWSSNGV